MHLFEKSFSFLKSSFISNNLRGNLKEKPVNVVELPEESALWIHRTETEPDDDSAFIDKRPFPRQKLSDLWMVWKTKAFLMQMNVETFRVQHDWTSSSEPFHFDRFWPITQQTTGSQSYIQRYFIFNSLKSEVRDSLRKPLTEPDQLRRFTEVKNRRVSVSSAPLVLVSPTANGFIWFIMMWNCNKPWTCDVFSRHQHKTSGNKIWTLRSDASISLLKVNNCFCKK